MKNHLVPLTAILCIASLEVIALSFRMNGLALSLSVGAICAITGRWSKRK